MPIVGKLNMVAYRIWDANIFTTKLVSPLTIALFVWVKISYDINLHILNAVRAKLSFNLAPLLQVVRRKNHPFL